jgi:hypothetical protein
MVFLYIFDVPACMLGYEMCQNINWGTLKFKWMCDHSVIHEPGSSKLQVVYSSPQDGMTKREQAYKMFLKLSLMTFQLTFFYNTYMKKTETFLCPGDIYDKWIYV